MRSERDACAGRRTMRAGSPLATVTRQTTRRLSSSGTRLEQPAVTVRHHDRELLLRFRRMHAGSSVRDPRMFCATIARQNREAICVVSLKMASADIGVAYTSVSASRVIPLGTTGTGSSGLAGSESDIHSKPGGERRPVYDACRVKGWLKSKERVQNHPSRSHERNPPRSRR